MEADLRKAVIELAQSKGPDAQTWAVLEKLNAAHVCDRCGKCCEQIVGMTGHEAILIAKHLGVLPSAFRQQYIQEQIGRWHIMRQTNGRCPFHDAAPSGSGMCLIYDARPEVCRRFPFLCPETLTESHYPVIACNEGICPNMGRTVRRAQGRE